MKIEAAEGGGWGPTLEQRIEKFVKKKESPKHDPIAEMLAKNPGNKIRTKAIGVDLSDYE